MESGIVGDPEHAGLRLTKHAERRLAERNISAEQVREGMKTAKESRQVTTVLGKYGTPVNIYNGSNGITVIEETAGRNVGRIITAYYE
ncbi:MAG: DUF4258 domain-containing protein [Acidobacteriaceae bacterium]|nr:DUF4258 domain-containing protein [Acidobacteriaceae bacterium]MBV9779330.1 DUF4258 domain-containing protein [Acidobacteriaceae bacterium]